MYLIIPTPYYLWILRHLPILKALLNVNIKLLYLAVENIRDIGKQVVAKDQEHARHNVT